MTIKEPLGEFDGRYTTRFTREYPNPVEEVWSPITEPTALTLWFIPEPSVDHRVGGRWTFVSSDNPYFSGSITAYEDGRRIEFSYDSGPVMRFTVEANGSGCRLRFDTSIPKDWVVDPSFVPDGYGWAEQPAGPGTPQPALNASWHSNLDGLRQFLEGAGEAAITAAARRERVAPDEWRELVDAYRAYIESAAPPA